VYKSLFYKNNLLSLDGRGKGEGEIEAPSPKSSPTKGRGNI
jgi:hypothetical protein